MRYNKWIFFFSLMLFALNSYSQTSKKHKVKFQVQLKSVENYREKLKNTTTYIYGHPLMAKVRTRGLIPEV